MKTHLILGWALVLVLCAGLSSVSAVPIGGNNTARDYLIRENQLTRWCGGVYVRFRDRDVTESGRFYPFVMESRKIMAYVGVDPVRWLTVYATAGDHRIELNDSSDDRNFAFGGGVRFNLMDHDILDPTLFEDKIRLTAGCQYTVTDAEYAGEDITIGEFYASLFVSVVNDVVGNKFYHPDSVALYAGPICSDLDSDELDEQENIGFAVGVEVFGSRNVSFDVGLEYIDSTQGKAGLHVRF